MEEQINIVDNIIQAISILNKTEEYLGSLGNRLSECDNLNNAFYHFIEMTPIEKVNLEKLYLIMQENLKARRQIKTDLSIRQCFNNNIAKLNNSDNREFLIAELKKTASLYSKKFQEYDSENLTPKIIESITKAEIKRGRGRPPKVKKES